MILTPAKIYDFICVNYPNLMIAFYDKKCKSFIKYYNVNYLINNEHIFGLHTILY